MSEHIRLFKVSYQAQNGYAPSQHEIDRFDDMYQASPALREKVAAVAKMELAAITKYESNRAAARKEKVVKIEKKTVENVVVESLSDLPALVAKGIAPGVKVFMPGLDGLVEVDLDAFNRLMTEMAGRGTESEEMFPTPGALKFPTQTVPNAGDGKGGNPPATPYGVAEQMYPVTRLGNNYVMSNMDPGIAAPAPFDAPEPGDNPATGEGGGPVFKSGRVPKGTFAGTMPDQTGQPLTPRRK